MDLNLDFQKIIKDAQEQMNKVKMPFIEYKGFTCALEDLKGYKADKTEGLIVYFGTFEVLVKGNYQDFEAKVKKANG